jgi:hypothetical protein
MLLMQSQPQPFDPTQPHEPDLRPAAPARSTTIPELGIADVHEDPGLAPALATSQPMPTGKPAGQPTTPEQRSQEFVPVEGGTETTSAGAMLVTAYLLMWAILIGFLLLSWRRQRRMDARIAELESALAKADDGPAKQ